jgi:Predicted nucleotide-binding protein containing TIR-like domain
MTDRAKLRVLVLYGGDAATNPRNELMAWLARDSLNVKATIVAEGAPHSEGAVDDRVDAAIAQADKAIALLTPDDRSPYGAPNVMDEIGRWRGGRGKKTLCIIRQDGVPPYSNHSGIPYVGFNDRVKEGFDSIREFLLDGASSVILGKDTEPKTASEKSVVVDSNPNVAMIDGRRYSTACIEELQGRLTIVVTDLDGEGEAAMRQLAMRRGAV